MKQLLRLHSEWERHGGIVEKKPICRWTWSSKGPGHAIHVHDGFRGRATFSKEPYGFSLYQLHPSGYLNQCTALSGAIRCLPTTAKPAHRVGEKKVHVAGVCFGIKNRLLYDSWMDMSLIPHMDCQGPIGLRFQPGDAHVQVDIVDSKEPLGYPWFDHMQKLCSDRLKVKVDPKAAYSHVRPRSKLSLAVGLVRQVVLQPMGRPDKIGCWLGWRHGRTMWKPSGQTSTWFLQLFLVETITAFTLRRDKKGYSEALPRWGHEHVMLLELLLVMVWFPKDTAENVGRSSFSWAWSGLYSTRRCQPLISRGAAQTFL